MDIDTIIHGDNTTVLQGFPDACVDLTVTSPPYDDIDMDYNPILKNGLREYNGYSWDFKELARQLYRVTKPGGVVVWVVDDPTINGSESLASSLQKIYFRLVGFNIHDSMIWNKGGFSATGSLAVRYAPVFEYMIVLSKGFPKTFNPIKDRKTIHAGKSIHGTVRNSDGSTKAVSGNGSKTVSAFSQRFNIWDIDPVKTNRVDDHPAPFPESLARDQITSWSNPGDIILDPFDGSGTTTKMAKETGRHWIGIDISDEYCKLATRRVMGANVPLFV